MMLRLVIAVVLGLRTEPPGGCETFFCALFLGFPGDSIGASELERQMAPKVRLAQFACFIFPGAPAPLLWRVQIHRAHSDVRTVPRVISHLSWERT